MGSNPGWETKILYAVCGGSQKVKINTHINKMYLSKLLISIYPWIKSKNFVLFTDEAQTCKTMNIPINMGNKQLLYYHFPITYLKITSILNLFKRSDCHNTEVKISLSKAWKA